ncbi:glycoside hydrolase family 3 N-terminal domain-containing protein [uncultured Amnibacterium sp.]|uniref:glycoside hydrolase family 3 N-terminal domain-containing protein n=1 Tax=uncultured Amnibacterium sp. TaxID=1631851 RepID=UPI0035C96825
MRRLAAGVLLPGFGGTVLSESLAARLRDGLAGVCLFGRNIDSAEQVRSLTVAIRAARPEAVVAADEEGGDVTRLHMPDGSPEPGNAVLGRIDDESVTAASAARIGAELAAAGITLDLAPTVDVNTNDDNPVIGVRSFGLDAALVARHTRAWVQGLQSSGVAACAKHFPGHGDTAVDSHLGLPVVEHDLDALRARELVPFVAALDAGVAAVMTSHIMLPRLDPDSPATMSPRILTGLLREELGFEGVIVTDALDMAGSSAEIGIPAAAVRSLQAGADLLCLGSDSEPVLDAVLDAIVTAVGSGELPEERLRDAAARVRSLAHRPVGREIVDSFDVAPAAAAALADGGDWAVVHLASEPNAAVGPTGWGPFAAAAVDPTSWPAVRFLSWRRIDLDDGSRAVPEAGARVLVIGRDIHRRPAARAVVEGLRAAGGTVVVVDMGWPSADRRYADVATFGASRAIGAALLHLLTGTEGH